MNTQTIQAELAMLDTSYEVLLSQLSDDAEEIQRLQERRCFYDRGEEYTGVKSEMVVFLIEIWRRREVCARWSMSREEKVAENAFDVQRLQHFRAEVSRVNGSFASSLYLCKQLVAELQLSRIQENIIDVIQCRAELQRLLREASRSS